MAVRTKICGVTSVRDARVVADAGADAIGLNFFAGPRRVDIPLADRIVDALPPLVTVVALAEVTQSGIEPALRTWLTRRRIRYIQMYGRVGTGAISQLRGDGFEPIYVLHVDGPTFYSRIDSVLNAADRPSAVLLDAAHPQHDGGTGWAFDWDLIRRARDRGALSTWPPIILAGGLRPDNVAAAIAAVRPWAVDVASGVESAPGCKDAALVRAFIEAAMQRA